jgi:hypothetical protein
MSRVDRAMRGRPFSFPKFRCKKCKARKIGVHFYKDSKGRRSSECILCCRERTKQAECASGRQ